MSIEEVLEVRKNFDDVATFIHYFYCKEKRNCFFQVLDKFEFEKILCMMELQFN